VVDLRADGFEIDDGTAVGRIVLVGEAAEYLPLIDPGDAINATGRVERREGAIVVVVSDPAGIARVGDLLPVAIEEEPSMAPLDRPEPDVGPSRAADLGGPFGLGATGTAGLASLLLISIASTAVTLLRRQRTRRALLARVAARVALVAGPTPAMPGDRPPGRRPEGHG